MSTTKFFAGALVGLVAGLLLAPEKGEDMRDEIVDTAKGWKKKAYKMLGKAGSELEDLKDMLSDEVEGLGDDVRKRILTMLEDTKSSANNVKKNAASAM